MRQWMIIVSTVGLLAGMAPLLAQVVEGSGRTVVVEEGQSVRDLAQAFLGDPELWPEILRQNGLDSVAQVRPGMRLKVFDEWVSQANRQLSRTRSTIESATEAGARVLAADEVGEAIRLYDQALVARREGSWERCLDLAHRAFRAANGALEASRARRRVKAEALVARRQGQVEARRSSDLLWHDTPQGSRLQEGQKVRTRSRSNAEIRFPDETRVQLAENSQAVIQSLRRDVLNHRKQSKMVLEGGDLQAILGHQGRGTGFDLAIPGVGIETESKRFWVSRREKNVRIANYEEAEIALSVAGGTLHVGKNQGAVLRQGKGPGRVRKLLPRPRELWPRDRYLVSRGDLELRWEPVEGAVRYALEIEREKPSGGEVVVRQRALREPRAEVEGLENGLHRWVVVAIDGDGLPGPSSRRASFRVLLDETPPFLMIKSPRQGLALAEEKLEIQGEAESTARLTVDGQMVEIAADGHFDHRMALPEEGPHSLEIAAQDAAGNVSRKVLHVDRLPGGEFTVHCEPALGDLVVGGADFLLRGVTRPGTTVKVQALPTSGGTAGTEGAVRGGLPGGTTVASVDGHFQLRLEAQPTELVPRSREPVRRSAEAVPQGALAFTLHAVSTAAQTLEKRFTIAVDTTPPQLHLEELPTVTKEPRLLLAGTAQGAESLRLNGLELHLLEGRFETVVELVVGENRLQLEARDEVGNRTRLQRRVVLDQEPPELLSQEIASVASVGGTTVSIRLQVHDASGLRRAAPFTLDTGDDRIHGHLLLDRSQRQYTGVLQLVGKSPHAPRLAFLRLEDELGQRREIHQPSSEKSTSEPWGES